MNFLHENIRFDELILAVGEEKGIEPDLIEKDYWIMHSLWGLQDLGFEFFMKGGTSLSKGYEIINRFSEDIDILITPPDCLEVKSGRNHMKPAQIESRKVFFKWLIDNIKISGIENVCLDPSSKPDGKYRNGDILLNYSSVIKRKIEKLKPGILLEVGFDQVTPFQKKSISSWAYDFAKEAGLECADNRAKSVNCYNPEYTFVEKLSAISAKFRKQQETGEMDRNFLRHYYDVYMLLKRADVKAFIGTDEYFSHKNKKFRKSEEKNLSKNEAFIMSDSDVFNFYNKKHIENKPLHYEEMPSFNEIMDTIRKTSKQL